MRRKGFTLIELLVVIAIIGILAAMLFPVFARARESARKTQCLSNVKNISLAVNMYMNDWEGATYLFPFGWDPRVNVGSCGFGGSKWKANPYLREPVILEDYIKNRDIWRCPSAKVMNGAGIIVPMGRDGLWWNAWLDGEWDDANVNPNAINPCMRAFPTGWGGDVTDSFTQGMATLDSIASKSGGGNKAFVQGIGLNDYVHFTKMNDIQDPAKWIVAGDVGNWQCIWNGAVAAFPDRWFVDGEPAAKATCSWSMSCGLTLEQQAKAKSDGQFQKTLTRHMGGSNVGFLDGHAKWYPYKTLLLLVNRDWKSAGDPTDNPSENWVKEPVVYGWGSCLDFK